MKKIHFFPLLTVILYLLPAIFASTSCFAYQGGSGIPSCHDDIAVQRTEPGTSPDCTPPILDKKKSREILEGFGAKKIKGKWYIFLSAEEFAGKMDSTSRWKTISLLVSAVESMFASREECLLVQIPETEEDKDALLAGNYPQRLIAASAKHVTVKEEGKEEEKEATKWPEYHHPLFYKITVF
ncbi:MAG: hypothetical protein K9K37_00955 [Desulfocapsa sp.]|nr:hypothetical protein [Desulfocapsa sp.]